MSASVLRSPIQKAVHKEGEESYGVSNQLCPPQQMRRLTYGSVFDHVHHSGHSPGDASRSVSAESPLQLALHLDILLLGIVVHSVRFVRYSISGRRLFQEEEKKPRYVEQQKPQSTTDIVAVVVVAS